MASYKLTDAAKQDIADIREYSLNQWGTDQTSLYLKQIRERMRWLAQSPKLGELREDIKPGYYSFLEGRHCIYYRIKKKNIEVLAVLHQSMDTKRLL
ncbi:MAG: type II toxin-antitoxin system RelE/ParE family toxin [Halioglobus sp.]